MEVLLLGLREVWWWAGGGRRARWVCSSRHFATLTLCIKTREGQTIIRNRLKLPVRHLSMSILK